MAKASVFASTIAAKIQADRPTSTFPVTVNLDEATRSSIIAAACVALYQAGARAWDLGEWRQRAAAWDYWELVYRAAECGVEFKRGNQPLALPETVIPRRGQA